MTDVEEPAEQIRWSLKRYGFVNGDDFFLRRNEKWVRPGTRNHGEWDDHREIRGEYTRGIQREERDDGDSVDIEDEHLAAIRTLIEGRTIVSFAREPNSGIDWPDGENSVTLTLDNGAELEFTGYGHDASGLYTSYRFPAEGAGEQREP